MRAVRHVMHLVGRFLRQIDRRPPSPEEAAWAESHLLPGERALWVRLGNGDRRHAIGVARRFTAARQGATRAETAGALLHDIGKVDGPEGALRRAWMTIDPRPGATTRRYRDHERLGAELCARAGSDPVTVSLILGEGTEEAVRTLRHADSASGFRNV